MIRPSALNFLVVAAMVIIFAFMWKMAAMALVSKNPDSQLGKAMGVIPF